MALPPIQQQSMRTDRLADRPTAPSAARRRVSSRSASMAVSSGMPSSSMPLPMSSIPSQQAPPPAPMPPPHSRRVSPPSHRRTRSDAHGLPTLQPYQSTPPDRPLPRRLSIVVPRSSLRHAAPVTTPPRRRTVVSVGSMKMKRVSVEPAVHNRSDAVFHVPFPFPVPSSLPAAARFLCDAAGPPVRVGDAFEVSFVGVCHPTATRAVLHSNGSGTKVHLDAHVPAAAFTPVPASRAVVLRRRAEDVTDRQTVIPLRFAMEQYTDVLPTKREGERERYGDGELPLAVRDALTAASTLGKKGLRRIAATQPLVIKRDLEFRLADPEDFHAEGDAERAPSSPHASFYLRYGYYFFLQETVDARLYAQTEASGQCVPLLMRRQRYSRRMADSGETEYFPLTAVPYVVLRVTPGCSEAPDNSNKNNKNNNDNDDEDSDAAKRLRHMQQVQQLLCAFADLN